MVREFVQENAASDHINSSCNRYDAELAKISKDAGLGGSSIIIGQMLSYASTVLATRILDVELFGVYYLAHSILLVATILSTLGLGQGVLRYVSFYDGKKEFSETRGTILYGLQSTIFVSILLMIVVFLVSSDLAKDIFHERSLRYALRFLIIALPFATAFEIFLSSLQGMRLISQTAFIKNVLQPFLRLLILATLLGFGLRLSALVCATALALILCSLVAFWTLLQKGLISWQDKLSASASQEIRKFSTPIYFDSILFYLIESSPVLLMGYYGTSFEVGVLGVAIRLGLIVSLPLTAFNMIFAPTISRLYGRGETETLSSLFKTITKWVFTASLAAGLIIILFARPVLSLFGQNFVAGVAALSVIVIAQIINSAVGSVGYMLLMTGRSKVNMINSMILLVLTVVLGVLLIPRNGFLGAALAIAIPLAVINILRLLEVYYFERIHPYSKNFAKPVLAGLFSILSVFAFRHLHSHDSEIHTLISVFLFCLAFVLTLFILKLEREDRFILNLLSRKLRIN